jgi:hypothetical protein
MRVFGLSKITQANANRQNPSMRVVAIFQQLPFFETVPEP